jgi:hypothetical protein
MVDAAELYRNVQRCWTGQDWDGWKATCAPAYTFDPGLGPVRDVEATMVWNRAFFTAFPDYTEEIRYLHAGPAVSVAELVGHATSTGPFDLGDGSPLPATGKSFEIRYAKVLEYDADGLVVRDHQYQDLLPVLQQLGLL